MSSVTPQPMGGMETRDDSRLAMSYDDPAFHEAPSGRLSGIDPSLAHSSEELRR